MHDIDLSLPGFGGGVEANFDGIGGEGAFFTGQIGFDWQIAPQFVLGAFFDYDFSGIETDINLSVPLAPLSVSAPIKADSHWSIGARFGVLPTASRDTLWYAVAGYTQLSMDDLTITASGTPSFSETLALPDFKGYFIGGGVETMLTNDIGLKAEYRFSQYDRESIFSDPGFIDVGAEPSMHSARLVVNYKFPLHRSIVEQAPLK